MVRTCLNKLSHLNPHIKQLRLMTPFPGIIIKWIVWTNLSLQLKQPWVVFTASSTNKLTIRPRICHIVGTTELYNKLRNSCRRHIIESQWLEFWAKFSVTWSATTCDDFWWLTCWEAKYYLVLTCPSLWLCWARVLQ